MSPAQELNSLAKVLAKFVNSANKRIIWLILGLLEKSNIDQGKEEGNGKSGVNTNDEESKRAALVSDGTKRRPNQKTEIKDNNARPPK